MASVLRWSGLGKVVSFYRHVYFNGPRVTTALGVTLLVGVAAVRLYWLAGGFLLGSYPGYLAWYFGLVIAAAVLASAGMVAPRSAVAGLGWALGGVVSAASLGMYVASRTAGLPGLPEMVGRWDYPLGTFAMALAATFLALHFSVVTRLNVAYPRQRRWHD